MVSKDVDIKDALTIKGSLLRSGAALAWPLFALKYDAQQTQFISAGWSCPQCENISSLLKEEEMLELVEAFDKLDENLDTKVTMDEFLKYQVSQLNWKTSTPTPR